MTGPKSPPPGAMPSPFASPDMQSLMDQTGDDPAGTGTGAGSTPPPSPTGNAVSGAGGKTQAPRDIGTPVQELKNLAGDVAQELLSVLPDFMQSILGVKPTDKPEDAARKRQMLQRYQQMNAEQQQYVQQKMQEEHLKKQKEEEELAQKRQAEQAKAQNDLPVPQGKTTGEGGPGQSSKQRTTTKLQNDRKKMKNAG